MARSAQQGAKTAQDSFNKFVEGPNQSEYRQVPIDESKKGFWDDFSSLADEQKKPSSSIGTSAMGKGGNRGPAKKDEWEDW